MRKWKPERFVWTIFLVVAACTASHEQTADTPLIWQPVKLTNGSPVLFRLAVKGDAESVSGEWLGHGFLFFSGRHHGSWYALAGIPLQTPAGVYTLQISEQFANGRTVKVEKQIKTSTAVYKKIPIRVARQFTEPRGSQNTL